MSSNQMSKSDSSRVQSSQAKGGGDMSSGGFAARAQSAGDRNNVSSGGWQSGTSSGGNYNGQSSTGGASNGQGSHSGKK